MRNILATFFLFCLTMAVIGQAAEQIPSANLRFSHKTHTQNSISCITCHVDREPTHNTDTQAIPPGWQPLRNTKIVASSSGVFSQKYEINDKFGRPGEKRCLECHFKSREKSDCGLCHLEKPGPTARTRKRLDADFVLRTTDTRNSNAVAVIPLFQNGRNLTAKKSTQTWKTVWSATMAKMRSKTA